MDIKLIALLVCPLTKTPLIYDAARSELISNAAQLAYPVRDGLSVLLESEARALVESELQK